MPHSRPLVWASSSTNTVSGCLRIIAWVSISCSRIPQWGSAANLPAGWRPFAYAAQNTQSSHRAPASACGWRKQAWCTFSRGPAHIPEILSGAPDPGSFLLSDIFAGLPTASAVPLSSRTPLDAGFSACRFYESYESIIV